MAVENRFNPARGKAFQATAGDLLSAHFNVPFQLEVTIPIGSPAKAHKFDLVSDDRRYVGECKYYSFTVGGNNPSAKMAILNEAVLYLSLLPFPAERMLVMPKSIRAMKRETLAEYYFRTYQYLLGGVFIVEIDEQTGEITELGRSNSAAFTAPS